MQRTGDNDINVVRFPLDCEACSEALWEDFGCGFHGFGGKSKTKYTDGAKDEYWSRTCPMYAASFDFINILACDLENYKRGSLGNVLDLDNMFFELLAVLENERGHWESVNMKQMRQK